MKIRTNSILDFLEFGLLAPGDDFFDFNLRSSPPIFDSDITISDLEKTLYTNLVSSLKEILENKQVDSFAISGGADSRLILSIILEHFPKYLEKMKIYCRVHPSLRPEEDRDSLIVMALSKQLGFNVKFESPDLYPSAYLVPADPDQTCCLSGIFGGNLLGGDFLENPIFDGKEIYECSRKSLFCKFITQEFYSLESFKKNELKIRYLTLMLSPLSAHSKSLCWLIPNRFLQYSKTPFINKRILDILFSCEIKDIKNFEIYTKILTRFCSKYLFVPINNLSIESKLNLGLAQWGKEPKLIPYNKEEDIMLNSWHKKIKEFIFFNDRRKYSDFLEKWLHLIPTPSFKK